MQRRLCLPPRAPGNAWPGQQPAPSLMSSSLAFIPSSLFLVVIAARQACAARHAAARMQYLGIPSLIFCVQLALACGQHLQLPSGLNAGDAGRTGMGAIVRTACIPRVYTVESMYSCHAVGKHVHSCPGACHSAALPAVPAWLVTLAARGCCKVSSRPALAAAPPARARAPGPLHHQGMHVQLSAAEIAALCCAIGGGWRGQGMHHRHRGLTGALHRDAPSALATCPTHLEKQVQGGC